MNRRDFIKTGVVFCGCVYLGFDIIKGNEVELPTVNLGSYKLKGWQCAGKGLSVDLVATEIDEYRYGMSKFIINPKTL